MLIDVVAVLIDVVEFDGVELRLVEREIIPVQKVPQERTCE